MRALAVEDDPRIARDVQAALGGAGFLVETVADGEEAWFLGDTQDYDLIVLDLGLPSMDGLTVLKRWRAASWSLSAWAGSAMARKASRISGCFIGDDLATGKLTAR